MSSHAWRNLEGLAHRVEPGTDRPINLAPRSNAPPIDQGQLDKSLAVPRRHFARWGLPGRRHLVSPNTQALVFEGPTARGD